MKEIDRNLISYGKITNKNKIVSTGNISKIYNPVENLIALAFKNNNLCHMTSEIVQTDSNVTVKSNMRGKKRYHKNLGHKF